MLGTRAGACKNSRGPSTEMAAVSLHGRKSQFVPHLARKRPVRAAVPESLFVSAKPFPCLQ